MAIIKYGILRNGEFLETEVYGEQFSDAYMLSKWKG